MLTPQTLQHLAAFTCPVCGGPLGRYHAYPVTDPSTLLNRLTQHAPHHRACALQVTEDIIATAAAPADVVRSPHPPSGPPHTNESRTANPELPPLSVICTVKSTPTSPSGRIVRQHKQDPASTAIRIFTPERIDFYHVGTDNWPITIVRPATNEEAEAWLTPALKASPLPGAELILQIASLQLFLPPRQKARP